MLCYQNIFRFVFTILITVGISIMTSNETLGTEKTMGYTFWYAVQVSGIERNYLTIDADGNITAQIKESQSGDSLRALGWYYLLASSDDPDTSKIRRLIYEKRLIDSPDFSRPLARGMRLKVFSIKADGKKAIKYIDAMKPVPNELAEIEQVVFRLFERLASTPLRTLAIDVSSEPVQIKTGDNMRINLEFLNTGKFPTEFRNPATFTETSSSSLRINFWKKVRNENDELIDEYESTLDLAGKEFLLSDRQAVPSTEQFLRIQPGEKLNMWTTIRFPKLTPGNYTLEAIYYGSPRTKSEETRHDLIVGEYHADLKEITVLKK